jgi:hypothetical protein
MSDKEGRVMTQDSDNINPLVEEIKTLAVATPWKTGAIALLNVIPYAGGAVASVIGEIGARRKFEKVCNVLSDLNSRLESHKVEPESHLSKDQIIEVVHETLQTAATASDERKLDALKNGLGYTFLTDDKFERKQLLLQVLRNCTSLELVVLTELYNASDPYIVRQGGPPPDPLPADPLGISRYAARVTTTSQFPVSQGEWRPMSNMEAYDKPTLLKFLAERIAFDEGATEGALRLLDGKGLADSGPNLRRRDCKVLKWVPSPGHMSSYFYSSGGAAADGLLYPIKEVRPTPLEASLTDFGRSFLSFCRHE